MGKPVDYSAMTIKTTQVTDVKLGSGQELKKKIEFVFHHNTWIYDPAKEDFKGKSLGESYTRSSAITAKFGDGTFMPRWEEFLTGMKAGGIRRMILSPEGLNQKQKLLFMFPKKHWIILDVEILEIK